MRSAQAAIIKFCLITVKQTQLIVLYIIHALCLKVVSLKINENNHFDFKTSSDIYKF